MAPEEGQGAGRVPYGKMTQNPDTPTLETERFVLRKLVGDDTAALYPTLSDPDQCRYLTRAEFASPQELTDWLCDPEWNGRSWSAIDKASGELAARVVAVPGDDQAAEIGYITVAHRQGEGVALECAKCLMQHLFETEGHHRLTAGTDPRNTASNRVLEKLGFRREAHYLQSVKTHIGWCDEYYWGMLASEWRERN